MRRVTGAGGYAYPELAEIVSALQMSIVLEVNGYPKPGNVTRDRPFEEIGYEDFLRAASSLRAPLTSGFRRARSALEEGKDLSGVWGSTLLESAGRAMRGRSNTIFGALLLEIPLGLGAVIARRPEDIVGGAEQVISGSTVEDSVFFVKAVRECGIGGLEHCDLDGEARRYDLNRKDIEAVLETDGMALRDLLLLSAEYDILAAELTRGFPVTRLYSKRYLEWISELEDPRRACSAVFCSILSRYPDTLIARKVGRGVAEEVRSRAEAVMEIELFSEEWLSQMQELDETLRVRNLNPGSLADLTAASIFMVLLRATD